MAKVRKKEESVVKPAFLSPEQSKRLFEVIESVDIVSSEFTRPHTIGDRKLSIGHAAAYVLSASKTLNNFEPNDRPWIADATNLLDWRAFNDEQRTALGKAHLPALLSHTLAHSVPAIVFKCWLRRRLLHEVTGVEPAASPDSIIQALMLANAVDDALAQSSVPPATLGHALMSLISNSPYYFGLAVSGKSDSTSSTDSSVVA